MKIKFCLLAAAISVSLGFYSCSNDLDILDDYKEVPVIYGLLNPNKKVNYIRLQRAYLGAGNALVMAQVPDSIYYDDNIVDLRIIAIRGGIERENYKLTMTTEIPKEEGLFTDVDPRLYKLVMLNSNGDTLRPDPASQYKLQFTNTSTGKQVTATTKIIEPFGILYFGGSSTNPKINLASLDPFHVEFYTSRNARIYGMIFRFNYIEVDKATGINSKKHVDYYLDNLISRNTNGNIGMEFLLYGQDIFEYLGSHIKSDSTVTRSAFQTNADFIFTLGTDELYKYVQVNQPSNTVNYIPEFTNLSEGKGIYGCRLDSTISNLIFTDATLDSLINGQFTKHIF